MELTNEQLLEMYRRMVRIRRFEENIVDMVASGEIPGAAHICTQVGHTGPLMPSEMGRPIPYLDEVVLTFPELRIVAGHIGYPWTDEMIAVAWKHANVFIDTSAYAPRYYPPQLVHYLTTYGQDKVLFGTNFPQLSWERCVQQVQAMNLPEEVQARFWGETLAGSFDSPESGGKE